MDTKQLREAATLMIRTDCFADVASAVLPYLDETPITETWLRSVGWTKGGSPNARLIYIDYLTIDNLETGEASLCDWDEGVTLTKPLKTRGDVRLLCLGLGISLKETTS